MAYTAVVGSFQLFKRIRSIFKDNLNPTVNDDMNKM